MSLNPEKLVKNYRRKNPYTSYSDSEIYENYKKNFGDKYDFPANPFNSTFSDQSETIENQPTTLIDGISNLVTPPTGPRKESIESIRAKNKQKGYFAHFKDLNPASWWATADIWGSDFAAKAYNESLAGVIFEMMYGAPKFEVKDEDNPWIEEIPQFFVGMMNPVDVMTLGIGSLGGKAAASAPVRKLLTKIPMPKFAKKLISEAPEKIANKVYDGVVNNTKNATLKYSAKFIRDNVAKHYSKEMATRGALQMSGNLGTYTTASSFIRREAEQRKQILSGEKSAEDYSIWDSLLGAAKDGFEMAVIGGATGGIIKGKLLPTHINAKMATNPSFAEKATKLMTGSGGQLALEVGAFSGGHLGFEALESLITGEDFLKTKGYDPDTGEEIKETFLSKVGESIGMNFGIVTGFKTLGKAPIPIIGKGRKGFTELSEWKKVKNPFDISAEVAEYQKAVKAITQQVQSQISPSLKLKRAERFAKEKGYNNLSDLIASDDFKLLPRDIQDITSKLTSLKDMVEKVESPEVKKEINKEISKEEAKLNETLEAMEIGIDAINYMRETFQRLNEPNGYEKMSLERKNYIELFTPVSLAEVNKVVTGWKNNPESAQIYFANKVMKQDYKKLTTEQKNIITEKISEYTEIVAEHSANLNNFYKPEVTKSLIENYANSFEVKVRSKDGDFFIDISNAQGSVNFKGKESLRFKTKKEAKNKANEISDYIKSSIQGKTAQGNQLYVEMRNGQDVTQEITIEAPTKLNPAAKKSVKRPVVKEISVEEFLKLKEQGLAREATSSEIKNREVINENNQLNNNFKDEIKIIEDALVSSTEFKFKTKEVQSKHEEFLTWNAMARQMKSDSPFSLLQGRTLQQTIELVNKNPKITRGEGKKSLTDLVVNSKLNDVNKQVILEYLNNKGLGGVDVLRKLTATPDRLAKNIELFEWAQKEGYEIHRLNAELTKDFFKEKGYTKTIENRYRNAFANFFGTSTGQQYGFAYDFMSPKGRIININFLGTARKGGEKLGAKQSEIPMESFAKFSTEKAKLFEGIKKQTETIDGKEIFVGRKIDNKDYVQIRGFEYIAIGKDGTPKKAVVNMSKPIRAEVIDAVLALSDITGARDKNIYDALKVENIDFKNGIIKEIKTLKGDKGAGDLINLNVKEISPDTWKKIETLYSEAKKEGIVNKGSLANSYNKATKKTWHGDSLKDKQLKDKDLNDVLKYMTRDVELVGGKDKKYITQSDFRDMILKDADFIQSPTTLKDSKGMKFVINNWRDFVDFHVIRHATDVGKTNYGQLTSEQIRIAYKHFLSERANIRGQETRKSPGVEGGEAFPKPSPEFMAVVKKRSKLSDKKLKEADIEGAAADFANGVIRVDLKKATIADVFHELYHRFKDIGTVDKGVKRLTEKAESLAKNTKEYKEWKSKEINKDRNFEEFVADVVGIKAANYYTSKGIISKISQIGKQLMSRVKKFFGVANFNDYTRLIAGRVEKGVIAPKGVKWGQEVRMKKAQELSEAQITTSKEQKENVQAFYDMAKKEAKKLNYPNVYEMFKVVLAEKRIVNEKLLKDIKDIMNNEPVEISEVFKSQDYKDLVNATGGKVKEYNKKLSEILEVREIEIKKGISEKDSQDILSSWVGVRGGLKSNASSKQLREYKDLLEIRPEEASVMNNREMINEYNIDNPGKLAKNNAILDKLSVINPSQFEVVRQASVAFLPSTTAIQWLGRKFNNKNWVELGRQKRIHDALKNEYIAYENVMEAEIIRNVKKKTWASMKNNLWVANEGTWPIELLYKWRGDKRLTKAQSKKIESGFDAFNKIVTQEYINSIDKKKFKSKVNIREREIKGNIDSPYKYLKKTGKVTDFNPHGYSKEAYVMTEYWKMMDSFFGKTIRMGELSGIKRAIYSIEGITQKDANKMLSSIEKDIGYIKKGYFPKKIADNAIDILNPGTKSMLEKRKRLQTKYAREKAEERYEKLWADESYAFDKGYKNLAEMQEAMIFGKLRGNEIKKGLTPWELGKHLAEIDFASGIDHRPSRRSIKHLQQRKVTFDAMQIKENGKLEFTYETAYVDAVSPYVLGMSQFLANLQVFPEIVKVGTFQPVSSENYIGSLAKRSKRKEAWAQQYVQDVFETVTGTGKIHTPGIISRGLETYSRWLSKTMLMFPRAGSKNLLVGNSQTLGYLEARDVAKAFSDVIKNDAKLWREFEKVGATAQEMKIYEGKGKTNEILDKGFALGLMKPTENINRFVAVMASKYEQARLIETIQTYKKGDKAYDKAMRRLKEGYDLKDVDISFLKKYGHSSKVFGESFKEITAKARLMQIENYMNQQAHIKTQGSTADVYMPRWAHSKFFKPALLFKRMAYQASVNTVNNYKLAIKHGNYSKVLLQLASQLGTGYALDGFFDRFLFGKQMPDENSAWGRYFWNMLFKGEFGGLLAEFMSPYEGSGFNNSIMPVYVTHGFMTLANLVSLDVPLIGKGTKTVPQATHDWLKSTSSFYNSTIKTWDKFTNKEKTDFNRFSVAINDFESREGQEKGGPTSFAATRRGKYFRNLKAAFYSGDSEKFSKQYWMTLMMIAHDKMQENPIRYTPSSALKEAQSSLTDNLKGLNPSGDYTFFPKTRIQKANALNFQKWALEGNLGKDYLLEMREAEIKYHQMMKKYMNELPYYTRKYNLKGIEIAKYDWGLK